MNRRPAFDSQQGVALIMVLLAMALVVILATGMTQQQSVRVFRAGHYLAQQQGHSVALGAEVLPARSSSGTLIRTVKMAHQSTVLTSSGPVIPPSCRWMTAAWRKCRSTSWADGSI